MPDPCVESYLVKHVGVKNHINKRHMMLEFEKKIIWMIFSSSLARSGKHRFTYINGHCQEYHLVRIQNNFTMS